MSLVFTCPRTGGGRPFRHPHRPADLARTRNIRLYVRCECCGDEHLFCIKDGKLDAA